MVVEGAGNISRTCLLQWRLLGKSLLGALLLGDPQGPGGTGAPSLSGRQCWDGGRGLKLPGEGVL